MFSLTLCLYLAIAFQVLIGNAAAETTGKKEDTVSKQNENAELPETGRKQKVILEDYKRLFNEHRAIQLRAVKSLMEFGDYQQRYKLVDVMLVQLFHNLQQAKQNLTLWGILPADPLPDNETIREAYSKVLENTALFGDMVLRMPDMVHGFYDKNREWHLLLAWAFEFCNLSPAIEEPNTTLLSLMAQEVKILPEDPNYVNPFKEKAKKEAEMKEKQKRKEKEEKKRKKIPRGPRLSKIEL